MPSRMSFSSNQSAKATNVNTTQRRPRQQPGSAVRYLHFYKEIQSPAPGKKTERKFPNKCGNSAKSVEEGNCAVIEKSQYVMSVPTWTYPVS
jgi:hypothetical protein